MQVLEKYFNTAFDAPDGIKKLRELILTLAMQGKLVPQDPNDQPASELLNEIKKEKEKLFKEGKIKKSKLISNDCKYKFNFDLPMGWSWTKLGTLCILENGDRGKNYPNQSALVPEGIPFINAGHLQNTKINLKNMNYISENRFELLSSGKVQKNDILFCLRGSLGKVALVENIEQGAIASSLVIVRLFQNFIFQEYVLNYFMSNLSYQMVKMHDNGTAQPNLSATDLAKFEIPFPPFNEQQRIVEKINQLMVLCDKLEKIKQQKKEKKLTVYKSAINQLLDNKDERNSQKGWHFISNHFNNLHTVKENVLELKNAILQLAIQGKLVPQVSNDEPASELLRKIKKIKNIPVVNSNEMSFSLPQNWEWERIVNLGITQTGTTPPKKDSDNYGNFIPFIGPGNIKNSVINYSGEGLSKKGLEKGRLIEKDSILMVCIGGSIGKHAMTNQDISCNQQINTITVYPELSTQYVYWAMASQYYQNTVINQAGGSATPIINKLKWSSIPIPVPPYNEQVRIVKKINQLMLLCNELEKQIKNSSLKQIELLNAITSNLGK